MSFVSASKDGVLLRIHVQPNARRNEIVGLHGESLKIKIKGPPEDGKANAELVAFLAAELGVAKSAVELVSGASSRAKVVRVRGLEPSAVERALNR